MLPVLSALLAFVASLLRSRLALSLNWLQVFQRAQTALLGFGRGLVVCPS